MKHKVGKEKPVPLNSPKNITSNTRTLKSPKQLTTKGKIPLTTWKSETHLNSKPFKYTEESLREEEEVFALSL